MDDGEGGEGGDASMGAMDAAKVPVQQTRASKRYSKIPAPTESVLSDEKRKGKRWIKRKGD